MRQQNLKSFDNLRDVIFFLTLVAGYGFVITAVLMIYDNYPFNQREMLEEEQYLAQQITEVIALCLLMSEGCWSSSDDNRNEFALGQFKLFGDEAVKSNFKPWIAAVDDNCFWFRTTCLVSVRHDQPFLYQGSNFCSRFLQFGATHKHNNVFFNYLQ